MKQIKEIEQKFLNFNKIEDFKIKRSFTKSLKAIKNQKLSQSFVYDVDAYQSN